MRFTEKYMCCRPTASYVLMALIRTSNPAAAPAPNNIPGRLCSLPSRRSRQYQVCIPYFPDDLRIWSKVNSGRQNDLVSVERVVDPRALHEALGSTPRVYGTKPLRLQPSKALFRRMGS
ncbi:hypothetical protein CC2G_002714 [Coprinopsis cinerea AmutBmut pab1-1]|nr:hypothetical protein CC2G_002714 [Coprinopsis cinerea AmutBmut pab1-1]